MSENTTIPGTRMAVDWHALVSESDIVLGRWMEDSYHGLLLGNGDVAASLFGPPELLTFHLGKNDIWDYRDPMDGKRPRPHREFLEKYADPGKPPVLNYIQGNDDPWNREIRSTYESPMPTQKPAGRVRFRNQSLAGAAYAARLDLWNAEIRADLGQPQAGSVRAWVSYPRNMFIAEYRPSGSQQFDIEVARHKDCTGTIAAGPELGVDGADLWVRYRFPADPPNYPQGFEYAMYGRVLGAEHLVTEAVPEFGLISQAVWRGGHVGLNQKETMESVAVAHVRSSGPVMLLLSVATSRDAPDPFARARKDVDDAQRAGAGTLAQEHRHEWHQYWQRSFVNVAGKPFLNRMWFFNQYLLACSWRPGRIAPGLFGSWAWEDHPLFGNDYHWDYNMQQAVWGAYSSNHLEQAIPYNEAACALLPTAVTDARETYGIAGAKFFLSSYPRNYAHNPFPMLHYDRMMSLNGWVAHPLWWYYLYSQDLEFLRTKAYPLLRECARFYEGYLTHEPEGTYDIWPTAAWDVDFTPHLKYNKTFPMDLSFIRYVLKACLAASELLDVDQDKRAAWQHIADNLHAYPTADTPNGKVFTAYEGADAKYHFPLATMMVFPGDDIGLHTTGPLRETALRTLASMSYASDEELLLAVQRVRLGIDDMDVFEAQLRKYTWPNGGLAYDGQWFLWIHGCGNTLWLNERLLQSYTGQLRVAPAPTKVGACFAQLRAVGAFLVSGEIRPGGEAAYVAITSEAGAHCSLIRPWGGVIRVREWPAMTAVPFSESNGALSFATDKGSTYVVDRLDDPWEKQPVHAVPKQEK